MPAPTPQRWAELAPQLDALPPLPPLHRREQLAAQQARREQVMLARRQRDSKEKTRVQAWLADDPSLR